MERGYVKLWRKSIDSFVFADLELWKLWCLCLMKANHKGRWIPLEGLKEPIKINPGQFMTGRESLHQIYYPRKKKNQKSALTLWRWLQILEKAGNLNIKSYTKYSIITISNWTEYQQDEQQMNNKRTTDEQQMNTNKNDKNDKNDKKSKKKVIKEKYLEFVFFTKEEKLKLDEKYGAKVEPMIEMLNNYIGQSGKKYKSHYHVMLGWVAEKIENKKQAPKGSSSSLPYHEINTGD